MRKAIIVLSMFVCSATSALAEVGVSIGINIPVFPQLAVIPGYPVYYAPSVNANYFFYDGMYWCFVNDNWYASSWYNGPWELVAPEFVPVFLLRVPVRYYRHPPAYFSGWYASAPPRWGEHWGHGWEQNHRGWDTWNHAAVPAPAPLPVYQRQYSGSRYPSTQQQYTLQAENYRYHPHEATVQRQYERSAQAAGAPTERAAPVQQSAAPTPRGRPQQAERREARPATQAERREAPASSPAEHREPQRTAATPPANRQSAAPAPTRQASAPPPTRVQPERTPAQRPSQQAVAPRPPRAEPPQQEHREVQRTAAAPPPMQLPQRQAPVQHEQPSPARAPQAGGPPPAHRQPNQEKEGEKDGK